MGNLLATVVFGLAASVSWGSGDFCGGLASRRLDVTRVVTIAYSIGFFVLIGLALAWREQLPTPVDLLWGVLGGILGGLGLALFYRALAIGNMGIVAATSAVLAAGLPVLFSIFTQGAPGPLQLGGFLVALVAIALISGPERETGRPKGLVLALLSGSCFGVFFILISHVSLQETFWSLAAARLSAVLCLLVYLLAQQKTMVTGHELPGRVRWPATLPFLLGAGVLDSLGNAFFVFAAHSGRLDMAAVLSSFYPAATVILATVLLRERVNRVQGLGMLLALIAIPLISY